MPEMAASAATHCLSIGRADLRRRGALLACLPRHRRGGGQAGRLSL